MITIVGVHGIGNLPYLRREGSPVAGAAAITAAWSGWLGYGLPPGTEFALRVAYYAGHLNRGTAQGADTIERLDADSQDFLIAWIEFLLPSKQLGQGSRTARARQAAEWATRHFGEAVTHLLIAFCREVHVYLSYPGSPRREAARDAVATVIRAQRPKVVVAHSLGSVVAYEALWHYPDLEIDRFVTIGSPLAMPTVILDRLLPTPVNGIGARPPGVRRWLNVADVGDIVALPRGGLAPSFPDVEDQPDISIGDWDFHTARGYLSNPAVRDMILGHPDATTD